MSITIEGNVKQIPRIVTGCYTFDLSMQNKRGRIGIPLRSVIEIYGPNNVGKSTMSYSLAGFIAAQLKTNIVLADFERFDPEFLVDVLQSQGFGTDSDSKLHYISEEKDEVALDALVDFLKQSDYSVGIIDSVGAISPVSELQGSLGDANMGRRAKLMGQFIRKTSHVFKNKERDAIAICINHQHPPMAGQGFAMTTPGGETLKYLYAVKISLKRKWPTAKLKAFPDGSYILEGKIVKNALGYVDRVFWLFMLSGYGIHQGMTAVWDCVSLEKASFERGTIKLGTEKVRIKTLIDLAHEGNTEAFEPFKAQLQNLSADASKLDELGKTEETTDEPEE